jgi:hypothetical protein
MVRNASVIVSRLALFREKRNFRLPTHTSMFKTLLLFFATALLWLRVVDGVRLSAFDWTGAGVASLGMGIIAAGWHAGD